MKQTILIVLVCLFLLHVRGEECDSNRYVSRACCRTAPVEYVDANEIDSILLMPDTCAIPPFCLLPLPYLNLRHEQEDAICAPLIDEFSTHNVSFIICKIVDGNFVCYGRGDNGSTIDFSMSPKQVCRITRFAGEVDMLEIGSCSVNVRVHPAQVGESTALSSSQSLSFYPILQPDVVPWRGKGSNRYLLKKDAARFGTVDSDEMFVNALMPRYAEKEEFDALNSMATWYMIEASWMFPTFIFCTFTVIFFVCMHFTLKNDDQNEKREQLERQVEDLSCDIRNIHANYRSISRILDENKKTQN